MSTASPAISSYVGVVIVHYGDPEPTRACLASILGDPSEVERRVVVVDNSDNLANDDLPPDVERLPCPDNPGFGAGANRGIRRLESSATCGAYIVLNHDVRLAPGYLDAAITVTRGEADRPADRLGAAAGPIYLDAEHRKLWYAGGSIRLLTGTVRQSRSPEDAERERDVGFLPGTALVLAPAAWRDVGGFDESIFLYHEDVDLCRRLLRQGWRLRFVPGLIVLHELGEATGSRSESPFYLEHLSRTRLRPFQFPPYRLYLAMIHTLWVIARSVRLTVRHGRNAGPRLRALWRGHLAALAEI